MQYCFLHTNAHNNVLQFNSVIWCHSEEDRLPFVSGSSQGFFFFMSSKEATITPGSFIVDIDLHKSAL